MYMKIKYSLLEKIYNKNISFPLEERIFIILFLHNKMEMVRLDNRRVSYYRDNFSRRELLEEAKKRNKIGDKILKKDELVRILSEKYQYMDLTPTMIIRNFGGKSLDIMTGNIGKYNV